MATVEELVRDVLASSATSAGAPLIAAWANNRYREIVMEGRHRHLRKIGELSLPARITTGTVSATRDSTTITPDTTAQAAWLTSPSVATHEYWYIRVSSAWYKVASVDALAATITLSSAFAEDDVSSGTYQLVKRYHAVATNARWLGMFMHTRLRRLIVPISLDEMDYKYPGRILTGVYPFDVCQVGVTSGGVIEVEVYPPPKDSEILHYVYWDLPTALTISSTLPAQIELGTLKEGVLIDLYRYEMMKAARKTQIEQAAFYRNEMNAQETKWLKRKADARAADRGVDDAAFILQAFGNMNVGGGEQRTARDIVMDRWNYPG